MPVEIIPRASGGSANVTLDMFGDNPGILAPTGGITTLSAAYVAFLAGVGVPFDATGAGSVVANLSDSTPFSLINSAGPISFPGSFTGVALTLTNCAALPTIPTGTASVTISGTTSTTTLPFDTTSPNNIDASGVTPTLLTTLDASAVTDFSGTGALAITYAGQALTSGTITTYFATLARAARKTGVTAGTFDFSGGTNASIPTPIQAGSVSGTASAAAVSDQLVLSQSGQLTATQFYFEVAPSPPVGSEGISSQINLGSPSGDAATDAATLATAINLAAIGWTATAIGTAFTCVNTDTVYVPLFEGDFFAGFTASAGFSNSFSYTGN